MCRRTCGGYFPSRMSCFCHVDDESEKALMISLPSTSISAAVGTAKTPMFAMLVHTVRHNTKWQKERPPRGAQMF